MIEWCIILYEVDSALSTLLIKYLSVFFVSMVPLIELRGAIPIALGMDLPAIPSIVVCVIGNMLPVPVIYFFARKFLVWGKDKPLLGGICRFFFEKGEKAGRKLTSGRTGKYGLLVALMLFVGIPLPGTGAWTGTLGASFLDMGGKETAISVSLGVIIAGVIMTIVSLLGLHIFGL